MKGNTKIQMQLLNDESSGVVMTDKEDIRPSFLQQESNYIFIDYCTVIDLRMISEGNPNKQFPLSLTFFKFSLLMYYG